MKNEQAIREALIANTINLIAEGGFEKATTKAITHFGKAPDGIKMNEVYIYRLFGSKEALYERAFTTLDDEFFDALENCICRVDDLTVDTTDKLQHIFTRAWNFIMRNESRCRCYVRYYYSIYFRGKSLDLHNRTFGEIVKVFEPLFKPESDVGAIMQSVLNTVLDFAIRVYNGDLEDTEINRPHIFNVLYCMMVTYFRDDIVKSLPIPTGSSTER